MAGEVILSCALNKANLPVTGTQQMAYVLIEAKPGEVMADVQMPLNFALVLDHSGSMSGEKLRNLKEAAKLAIDQMGPQDYISVVIFDDKVSTIAPGQPVSNKAELKSKIDAIRDGGGTEMSKGMRSGLQEIQKAVAPNRVSRMLLLTDGQTFGDEAQCKSLATDICNAGASIVALGLGEDWNEDLLDAIKQASGGDSDFIEEPGQITKFFERTVQSMQATVVQNAEMVLRLVPGVTPRQVWQVIPLISNLGYHPISDRDVQVSMGELEKGQGKTLMVELIVPPRQEGRYRIAQAEVSYDVPATSVVGEKAKMDIVMNFTTDAALSQQYDARVMNIVEKVTAFKLQTRALDEAAAGDIPGATKKLRAAATKLLDMGEDELAQAAMEEAQRLEQGQQMSAKGTKKLRYETRKLTQKLDET
jgi:Ca-activated chloride channel family protein